jgi:hypothetical protein
MLDRQGMMTEIIMVISFNDLKPELSGEITIRLETYEIEYCDPCL